MRALVVTLAILAGLKIWTHQTLFRAASEQALLHAYRMTAAAACQNSHLARHRDLGPTARKVDWRRHGSAKVVMGDERLDVAIWQVDHKLWDARYKTPYIHLEGNADRQNEVCVFNVLTGGVSLLQT